MQSTLVLNASYEPHDIVSARTALRYILKGIAVSVDDSPRFFNSETLQIPVPYVVQFTSMAPRRGQYKRRNRKNEIPFSRRGVLVRDKYTCAYCGLGNATTIDHILPRALGGLTTWQNCVAACEKCNSHKGHIPLEKLGWKLKVTPYVPTPEQLQAGKQPWYFDALKRVPKSNPALEVWNEHVARYDPKFALSMV